MYFVHWEQQINDPLRRARSLPSTKSSRAPTYEELVICKSPPFTAPVLPQRPPPPAILFCFRRNLGFVTGLEFLRSATFLAKLLIPSVTCAAADQAHASGFLAARLYSLALSLFYVSNDNYPGRAAIPLTNPSMASAMGHTTLRRMQLAQPTADLVQETLHNLCQGMCMDWSWGLSRSSTTYYVTDREFQKFVGAVTWVTVVLVGFGTEMTLGRYLTSVMKPKRLQVSWVYAQFLFPLLAIVSLLAAARRSVFCLPFLVVGLWKFGFPETSMYLSLSRKHGYLRSADGASHLLNGVGTVLHHSSAAFLICFMCVGVIPPERAVLTVILPMIAQHWGVLIKYWSFHAYSVVMLMAEVLYEWETFASFEELYSLDVTVRHVAATMLLAHWAYMGAALLQFVGQVVAAAIDVSSVEGLSPTERISGFTTSYMAKRAASIRHTEARYRYSQQRGESNNQDSVRLHLHPHIQQHRSFFLEKRWQVQGAKPGDSTGTATRLRRHSELAPELAL